MIPYNFTDAGRGYINITKTDDNPDTKFVLYTDRDNGYGMYTSDFGVDDDSYQVHRLARPGTFEYCNGQDGRYYRIAMPDIRDAIADGTQPAEPGPLDVRHQCWFGESDREMHLRLAAEMQRRLDQAIAQAKQRKADAEERRAREAEEAARRERVEAEFAAAQTESYEEALARMLAEAGLSEYAE